MEGSAVLHSLRILLIIMPSQTQKENMLELLKMWPILFSVKHLSGKQEFMVFKMLARTEYNPTSVITHQIHASYFVYEHDSQTASSLPDIPWSSIVAAKTCQTLWRLHWYYTEFICSLKKFLPKQIWAMKRDQRGLYFIKSLL